MIELNKVYEFTLNNVRFADLNKEELNSLFQDGRVASHFLEIQITKWFPELERKEIKRGRAKSDHTDGKKLYEMKNFTKYGCKVMPSYQYGGNRSFNFEEFNELAQQTTYIICDIRNFPNITVLFKKGSDMVKLFPTGLIGPNEGELLYG